MDTMGISPSHWQFEERIYYEVTGPMTPPLLAAAAVPSEEAVFGFHQVLKLRLVLTLNDSVECVPSCDRIIHELNDSDSVRRAPGLLALVEGNGSDTVAPQGSSLFIVLLHGRFRQRADSGPLQGSGPEVALVWQRPCHGHWLFVGEEKCVHVFFAIHFQVADFDAPVGLCIGYPQSSGNPPKCSWKSFNM